MLVVCAALPDRRCAILNPLQSLWLGSRIFSYSHSSPKCLQRPRFVVMAAVAGAGKAMESPSLKGSLQMIVPDYDALPPIQAHMRVVLVRHGESTWNEAGRIQGSSDYAILTRKGESQAETSRQMLLADSFDTCFISPLARAKRTAEIIWDTRKSALIPLHDLREIDLYSFQGLLKDEGKDLYGDAYRMWQKDAVNFVIDGHYPVRELWVRAQKCWGSILNSKGSSILVVAHNAVNQALVATATGLGPEYFRQLLQSNCGVSVLDFCPRSSGDGPPYVCLDRLNQTPSPPVAQAGGRKARTRIVLVCHGATDSSVQVRTSKSSIIMQPPSHHRESYCNASADSLCRSKYHLLKNIVEHHLHQDRFAAAENEPMNMLGIIQSRKAAELLLDLEVDLLLSGPQPCAKHTASAIAEVQEAADCLGVNCKPRYVEVKELPDLRDMNWGAWQGKLKGEVVQQERWQDYLQHEDIPGAEKLSLLWERAGQTWQAVLNELSTLAGSSQERTVVVVGHETVHVAMLGHCLGLTQACLGSFHLDTGSLSVIDLPDGPSGKGVVRCLNYTAHLGRWAVPVTRPGLADEDF